MDKILRSILGTSLMAFAGALGAVVAFAWSPQINKTGATPSHPKNVGTAKKNLKFNGMVVAPGHKVETPPTTGPATGKRNAGSPSTRLVNKGSKSSTTKGRK